MRSYSDRNLRVLQVDRQIKICDALQSAHELNLNAERDDFQKTLLFSTEAESMLGDHISIKYRYCFVEKCLLRTITLIAIA